MTTATIETFEVGQVVRFRDVEENGVRRGFTGRITAVPSVNHGSDLIDVEPIEGHFASFGWFPHRFELVDETPAFEVGQRVKIKQDATLHGTALMASLWGAEGAITQIDNEHIDGAFLSIEASAIRGRRDDISVDLTSVELIEPEPEPDFKVGDEVIVSDNPFSRDGHGFVESVFAGKTGVIEREMEGHDGVFAIRIPDFTFTNVIHKSSLTHADPIKAAVDAAVAKLTAEHEAYKRRVSDKALEMAEEHGLCEIVENTLRAVDLPVIEHVVEATYTVTLRAQRSQYVRKPLDDTWYLERVIEGITASSFWKDVEIQKVELVADSGKLVEESAA